MKGQEKDIVFIVGMDNETFPDYRAMKNGGIEIQQEKNNFYVAVTRAKRYLYITYPTNRKMPWGDNKQRIKSKFL
jgi:DNA helicase-2/ATP-dependent DNA helicase PcrA